MSGNTDNKKQGDVKQHRRALLKSIAAAGTTAAAASQIPKKWSRPVVDSVLLPAHAQMSPTMPIALSTFACTVTGLDANSNASTLVWGPPVTSSTTHTVIGTYTYAAVTGTSSSTFTTTGTSNPITIPTHTGSYVYTFVFDSTCAG